MTCIISHCCRNTLSNGFVLTRFPRCKGCEPCRGIWQFSRGELRYPAVVARRPKDIRRAKYELVHTVRVHLGCEDDAFGCMGNGEDSEGIKGVFLRRNVVSVAGRALKVNLQRLGPLTLPITEMVRPPLVFLGVPLPVHPTF